MPRPLHPFVRIVRAVFRPVHTVQALLLRVEMLWLVLHNRFGSSPVSTGKPGTVVSLTTHGKRIRSVHLTIESIVRGVVLPSRLLLWIDDATLFASLPAALLRLKQRGLEIRLCKNYGPHTKYFPYLESQEPLAEALVTADDDIIYPRRWLAGLVAAHEQFPHDVNCYRGRVVTVRDWKLAPYSEWTLCRSTEASYRTMATGVSGVIYPEAFQRELKLAGTGFRDCCPKADDVWLHVQAIRAGFPVRQIQPEALHFPLIPGTQDVSLWSENWEEGADGNDRQSAVTYREGDLALLLLDSSDARRNLRLNYAIHHRSANPC
jgi:hypothetical protein